MLTAEKPAVRVEAAWKKPMTTRFLSGRAAMGSAPSCARSRVSERLLLSGKKKRGGGGGGAAHVEDEKKEQIQGVEDDEDPKQPPAGPGGKEEGEAAAGVVEEEAQLLPQAGAARHHLGREPDEEAQHDGEARVANDDEEPHDHEDKLGPLKGNHAVGRQGEANVHKGHVGGEEAPPGAVDARLLDDAAVRFVVLDKGHEAGEDDELEAPEVDEQDAGEGAEGAVLDAAKLLALLERQADKV